MAKKAPVIRFKGFEDDWEQRKLGEISEKVMVKNTLKVFTETFTNSAEFGIISQVDFFDKQISNNINIQNYYVVSPNDFVYNPRISNRAPVGPIKRNKLGRTGVMSPLYYVFKFRELNSSFAEHYFNSYHWHKFMYQNGDSGARADRFAIKDSVFNKMPIPYPAIKEQEKIGVLFGLLENTLELHQRKVELLQQFKKGFLQKMFPSGKEKIPQIRFANFEDDWEQCRLGKILKTHPFRLYMSEIFGEGKYEIIQQGDKPIAGYADGKPFKNFVDVTLFGDHTVSLYKPSKPFFIATDGVKILSADGFDGNYLFVILERYRPESQGYKRHFTILKNEKASYTKSRGEQLKIGSFFKQLDDAIDFHQRELKKLEDIKNSFLQKMFI